MSNEEVKVTKGKFLVSKTDLKGDITYCNREFMRIAGYSEAELLGQPHNIVRHEDMPKAVFKLLWDYIQEKREIFAFVKNKTKTGGFYWVYANVTASLDVKGDIVGYYSVRRKPEEHAVKSIEGVYAELNRIEKVDGMKGALKFLNDFLDKNEYSYNEFAIGLQHGKIRI